MNAFSSPADWGHMSKHKVEGEESLHELMLSVDEAGCVAEFNGKLTAASVSACFRLTIFIPP